MTPDEIDAHYVCALEHLTKILDTDMRSTRTILHALQIDLDLHTGELESVEKAEYPWLNRDEQPAASSNDKFYIV